MISRYWKDIYLVTYLTDCNGLVRVCVHWERERERERERESTIWRDRFHEQLKTAINNLFCGFMYKGRQSRPCMHWTSMGKQKEALQYIEVCFHVLLKCFNFRCFSSPKHSSCVNNRINYLSHYVTCKEGKRQQYKGRTCK